MPLPHFLKQRPTYLDFETFLSRRWYVLCSFSTQLAYLLAFGRTHTKNACFRRYRILLITIALFFTDEFVIFFTPIRCQYLHLPIFIECSFIFVALLLLLKGYSSALILHVRDPMNNSSMSPFFIIFERLTLCSIILPIRILVSFFV